MSEKRMTVADMAEITAKEQRKRADALDADPAYQARIRAKREAEIQAQIKAGIRGADGEYIYPDEDEDQDQ